MGVTHVGNDFQPWFGLIFRIDAGGISFESGIVYDTAIVEETCTAIIFELSGSAADGEVVLLTEGIMKCLLVPVVRKVILCAI